MRQDGGTCAAPCRSGKVPMAACGDYAAPREKPKDAAARLPQLTSESLCTLFSFCKTHVQMKNSKTVKDPAVEAQFMYQKKKQNIKPSECLMAQRICNIKTKTITRKKLRGMRFYTASKRYNMSRRVEEKCFSFSLCLSSTA